MINKQSYQIQGMKQDNLVATGFSSKFAHEIMNMRLNTIGDYTTASWTTEKGTKEADINAYDNSWFNNRKYTAGGVEHYYELSDFIPIGQANINDSWILFGVIEDKSDTINTNTRSNKNYISVILRIDYIKDTLFGRVLYWGNLNFNPDYPIETITFYENEEIQKVYWTDNYNQPRVININSTEYNSLNTTQFDFVQEVGLTEDVKIIKSKSNGMFPPSTVKYVITYYKKYGQESNIVYESPLYYPINGDRGCSPDELSSDSFTVNVFNVDKSHGFDYIRLYSIVRTSNNATPIVRIVEDKYIKNLDGTKVVFVDTNTTGTIVDPSILQYIGGRSILVETMNQKDNTLFLGGITLNTKSVSSLLSKVKEGTNVTYSSLLKNNNTEFSIDDDVDDNITQYKLLKMPKYNATEAYFNQLNFKREQDINLSIVNNDSSISFIHYGNSFEIKQFKKGESYRTGIQFQDKYGVWSEVIRLNDILCEVNPQPIEENKGLWSMPYLKFEIDSDVSSYLLDNDYKKARLVCCYTTNADRSFIAQGIINQTVYNKKERENNSPYAEADWFFRPFKAKDIGPNSPYEEAKLNFKEIQSIRINSINDSDNDSIYSTSKDVWTLNSPDIEFDETLRTLPINSDWDLKVTCGLSEECVFSAVDLDATKGAQSSDGTYGVGLKNKTQISYIPSDSNSKSHEFGFHRWNDADIYEGRKDTRTIKYPRIKDYPLIPFQRETSLNNYVKDMKWWYAGLSNDGEEVTLKQHAKINTKTISTLGFVSLDQYSFSGLEETIPWGTNLNFQFFDSKELAPLRLSDNHIYYGNQNTIANINSRLMHNTVTDGQSHSTNNVTLFGNYLLYNITDGAYNPDFANSSKIPCSDPVSITYKTTPHIVFEGTPGSGSIAGQGYEFYIADVYRSTTNKFGGIDNKNNIYTPCGPAVTLTNDNNNVILYGYEGDHYFMRYDCLKTYPFTTEDTNQIVEILSFPCFSRINLDGRYDRNRLQIDNTTMSPTNFNLINKSYTQDNNFFSYTELRDDFVATEINNFANQITWTKTKVSGEDVDTWTNITLASTIDADGTSGKITKITNWNGRDLTLFQEHGIAKINYNENTAIPTENGLPLELAKTGKLTGIDYITKDFGCQNKWSISQTKNGLMWIDDSRQELLSYGESIQSLSTINGFDSFLINNLPKEFVAWNPRKNNNFVTYYDKLSNDIYYINKDYCLAWNEQTKTFTSFYNYENTPYMVNLGSHSLLWHNGVWLAREADTYSTFFGATKDYWITLVCDGQTDKGSVFPADKVFNNIEYRADIYNLDGTNTNYSKTTFNKQHVWNGYQDSEECSLNGIRKFNTWRVQLPRHHGTRDRIRNPFCYIKLKQDQSIVQQTDRVILHDLAVYFDMR